MKEINIEKEKATLNLSKDEFDGIINALNEVCNGFKVLDFEKKIGVSNNEARKLLRFLSKIYEKGNFSRFNYM